MTIRSGENSPLDTAEREVTICMECGAAVREWTDLPECANSADKRHGPLKVVSGVVMADEYQFDCTVPLAELREENERISAERDELARENAMLKDALAASVSRRRTPSNSK